MNIFNIMKQLSMIILLIIIFPILISCSVVKDLDDQVPYLIVNADITDFTGTVDNDHMLYLIYYNKNDWSESWLQHGSADYTITNPAVITFSTYLVLFHDKDGSTTLSTGDPIVGYRNVTSTADDLTKLEFYPLETRIITLALNDANIY